MSLCFFLVTFRNVFIMSSVLLELAWFVFYFQFKSMLHCNKMTTQGNSIQWIKGEGFCFKLLSCLWKCMCLLAYVEWLNKHVKLIKGGEPWWFQRPTSHSVLSPSLVARPSSSSDFCQVLHEYPLPPPRGSWSWTSPCQSRQYSLFKQLFPSAQLFSWRSGVLH